MDLVRFGIVIRALRRRRGWRQVDLAAAAGVSQALVSMIERGHADQVLLALVMAVVVALDARPVIDIRWRAGELDRLLDEDHASVAATIARVLDAAGWEVQFEVTYSIYGAHGSIDVLAWHAATRTLLVVEVKTEVTSVEATIRKLDEKVRLGSQIALQRFGWQAAIVSRLLVIQNTSTNRRRVERAGGMFAAAFPVRSVEVRRWLRSPVGGVSALLFVSPSTTSAGMSPGGGRHRVRRASGSAPADSLNVADDREEPAKAEDGPTVLTNWR